MKRYICSNCKKRYKYKSRLISHEINCVNENKTLELIDRPK